jgi:hypothetical protein
MCGGFLRIQFHQERFPPQAIAPSGRSLGTSARSRSVSVRVSVPKERRFSVAALCLDSAAMRRKTARALSRCPLP